MIKTETAPPGTHRVRALAQWKHLPIAALISAYLFWFCFLSIKMYDGYGYPPFDLAIFDQGLWLLTHFHAPFVTVMGRDLFGDHTSFILLAIAPFYRLVPEPQGLLLLQASMLAGAAIPIYLLAQKLIHNTAIATLLAATYLLNPALQNGNMEQFHPEAFQVLIISVAIYAAVQWKPALLGTMVVLALLVKEDAGLLVIPLGLWVVWRRDRSWGLGIIAGALLWTGIANELIIPSILGANTFYTSRIPFGGLSGLLSTLVHRPTRLVSYLRAGGRPYYVWQMGFSVGWGFLIAPKVAATGILVFAENVLSDDPYMHQLIYHYSMPLVPVLVLGSVVAVAAQKSIERRSAAAAVVVLCALCSCVLWGLTPFSVDSFYPADWTLSTGAVQAAAYLEKGLPSDAVVSAWYPLVSHVDHRTQVYVWPTPFSASNWGLGTNSGVRLPFASQVQYLMLPVSLGVTEEPKLFASLSKGYTLVRSEGGLGLYKQVGRG